MTRNQFLGKLSWWLFTWSDPVQKIRNIISEYNKGQQKGILLLQNSCLYSGVSGNMLEKFRTKLHWMQAHDSLMATAFSLISFQSFLLWRDKGKDYDQDEVMLRQLRSACSKTTRQLMGISTFYLASATLSLNIESFFLVSSCFPCWVVVFWGLLWSSGQLDIFI